MLSFLVVNIIGEIMCDLEGRIKLRSSFSLRKKYKVASSSSDILYKGGLGKTVPGYKGISRSIGGPCNSRSIYTTSLLNGSSSLASWGGIVSGGGLLLAPY